MSSGPCHDDDGCQWEHTKQGLDVQLAPRFLEWILFELITECLCQWPKIEVIHPTTASNACWAITYESCRCQPYTSLWFSIKLGEEIAEKCEIHAEPLKGWINTDKEWMPGPEWADGAKILKVDSVQKLLKPYI